MTDSNAFFRFVWRVNALVILFTAVGAAFIVGAFAVFNLGPMMRDLGGGMEIDAPPRPDEQRAPSAAPAIDVRLGAFQAAGEGYYAPVYRAGGAGDGGFSKGSAYDASALNLVFFDPATNAVRRLLPDDRGLITQQAALRDGSELSGRIRGLLLTYVSADTDGDGRLDAGDAKRIILVRPDGSAMVTLADGVDALDTTWRADGASTLRYFTRVGDEVRYGEVDLDSFVVKPGRAVQAPKP